MSGGRGCERVRGKARARECESVRGRVCERARAREGEGARGKARARVRCSVVYLFSFIMNIFLFFKLKDDCNVNLHETTWPLL